MNMVPVDMSTGSLGQAFLQHGDGYGWKLDKDTGYMLCWGTATEEGGLGGGHVRCHYKLTISLPLWIIMAFKLTERLPR